MSRFRNALFFALALHGAFFALRTRYTPPLPAVAQQPALELIDVTEVPAEVLAATPAESPANEPALAANRAPGPPRLAERATVAVPAAADDAAGVAPPSSSLDVGADALANAASARSSSESAGEPARKIDLHLGDGFFMRPPSASEAGPRQTKSTFQRQLEASISADDVKRGLARGNALLGSLNAAVRDGGPVRGEALVSVTVGADGSLTSVEFLRGSAAEWSSAVAAFRALAARKRVRVPAGARGMRVTYSVQAKVQLPSGKAVGSPIDVRPSGLALQGTFDVADIGANAQRLVYARVVSEEVL